MKKWNIALGYYQELSTAKEVLAQLKCHHYSRFASIHHKHDHTLEINRHFPLSLLAIPFIATLVIFLLIILSYFQVLTFSWLEILFATAFTIKALIIYTFWHLSELIDSDIVNRYKNLVISDEILVIVQVSRKEVREVLAILRQVKSGHPVTFLLRPELFEEPNVHIPTEPLTLELQAEEATKLSAALKHTSKAKDRTKSLHKRFNKINTTLQFLRQDLADAEYIEQTVLSSAEWLLDNMYVLEGSIEDIKLNLPKKYYQALPKIVKGPLKGFPRIYALGIECVKNCAGSLNRQNITNFLESYQINHPLTIGELWAFPLMLRLRLVEWVEYLAIHVDNRMREGELASFWGNRLLYAARYDPVHVPIFLEDLSREQTSFTGHFAEELLDHLFDEESVLPMVREWLERHFASPLADVLHEEHMHETTEQVLFANSIRSLITLSQLSWPDIFETVSPVDAILRQDAIYPKMDFASRNSYREAIEEIARRIHLTEVSVAKKTIALARKGAKVHEKHIGYYLIDAGRNTLETKVGFRPKPLQSIRRWILRHAEGVYIGAIALLTIALECIVLTMEINQGLTTTQTIFFLLLSLLPITELSVQIVNFLLTTILPTSLLPKMLFEDGIPKEDKTLVVVPIMLLTPDSIREEIERLEIRYLANTDPQLSFGLFSDYSDAPTNHEENDSALLAIAVDGLKGLAQKYGEDRFYLFHRQRIWSNSENRWIGWERKRGKLEYLNRFLMGEKLPENIVYMGNAEALRGIRYVITLDADTQLGKDQARELIEVLSHPLNRPYLLANKKGLERGYTIIQPMVGTDFFHSRASRFCRIFSEAMAVDPYTQAISNVYQDLTGEGSYHGKGIYDVNAFHTILSHHFPEEHLLSHDLIEGAFVRTGFASNICLFDLYPKDYWTWAKRQHRWLRGDWQIIDWLWPRVPLGNSKTESNTLSWINRWKIFDNLRRAILPIAILLLLILVWTVSAYPDVWTWLAVLVLLLPCISLCTTKLLAPSWAGLMSLMQELKISILRLIIKIALLPFEAYLSLDAMVRVAFRRLVSHRNLLEWASGDYKYNGMTKAHQKFILKLGLVSLFSVLVLFAVIFFDPLAKPVAIPFCLLWIAAPFIVYFIDRPLELRIAKQLSDADQYLLREKAHQTWRYFEDMVGPQTHWLPPDNYQTALNVEIAQRTSPTNIGMWLLAAISAYDFEFISFDTFIDKTSATIRELKNLQRHEGHFLNWYNIQTLDPLFPRYVSTVDSGNLLACFWTLKQALNEMTEPIAAEKQQLVDEMIAEIDRFTEEMNLTFLYNNDRKLFTIGYNVDEQKHDSSFYDLLASEARIASLVAIAKEDVPLEHWWALGRAYNIVNGRKVLLSWGGTMFEYLMPLIFNKQYPDSLLGAACDAAVACQIDYGKKRGIPWGISESAYSGIDAHKIYQYKSFGVPGLGLKRGLEKDLVTSPYSSALALVIDPRSAIKNLKKMEEKHISLVGAYGYYEAIDFTRQRSRTGERGVVVYVYMAHHQGMTLSAINNTLNNDALSRRFHKDPRICGVNSLLYERVPLVPHIKTPSLRKEPSHRRLEPFSISPIMGVVETPESVTPKINLLSNGSYSLMITNSGGGYSRWNDIDIYRWRADTTQDNWGSFYYIKDMKSGAVWSAAYQPTKTIEGEYSVNFTADKADFRRKDYQIETHTEIVVSPEDNAEIRLITLTNLSIETRYIELTSYLELVLAPHLTDRSHPCFNKLFIETEAVPELSAVIGFRRLRSPEDRPIWAAHGVSVSQSIDEELQYETDRGRFIGRGNSLEHPAALEGDLSNTTGTVLDPILSLRRRVVIQPGSRVQISFVTAVTDNRPAAIALIEKYKEIAASHRALELAWTYAQLELRHLRIHQEEVQLFQKLASRVIYPHIQLRTTEERMVRNRLGQSGLWSQGISGDFPIVVATVGDIYDVDLVKQLLIAHTFWQMRGLKTDLVIFNEEEMGYMQPLQEHLQNLIRAFAYRGQIDVPGGIFLRNTANIKPEELNLILSVARAILIAARGTLRQQLVSPKPKLTYPPKLIIHERIPEVPSRPLPFLELPYFNGLGGYSSDGRSYVIYLGPKTNTPAPWINVLANPQFGTLVSEAGLGTCWYGNSQTNRLTPWSNDPLLDPISDTIYIRDDNLGTVWTPTPAPIRELDAYRITHGQGYSRFEHNSHGIEQELVVFVPVDDKGGLPLRIQRLKLKNLSSRKRRLTLTAYSEWVLGNAKEETQMHVVTEWDSESQSLFAYNRFNPDFGDHVAFACSTAQISSYTGDRAEFIGRNRSSSSPEGLTRVSLSEHTGAGLDPCAALQVTLEIDPGKDAEAVFIIGYASDAAKARELIVQCRSPGKIDQLLADTQAWWDKTLGTIQVDLPDLASNFSMNRWLAYQALSCRFWGRSGFYQSSGAYGFRDQLQDVMALTYSVPDIAREYILTAAARQYIEGDVQHWWHPQTGAGVRTRCSDDLLWLPFVTSFYVRVTGDASILEEKVTFLEGEKLAEDQDELFQVPKVTEETATLLEHCRRAIKKGSTAGPHGLPLIGSGDWNDGMNRVGIHGKGESVWLAWFLIQVMNDFADLLGKESGERFRVEAKRLAEVVEASAWDGAWYRRAYFDDGTPIGSKENVEAFIDSLTQSWAVITGLADPERTTMALKSANEYLVKDNLVLLLTPPFDKTPLDPGYIKGYPPGVRENGGQYTHGSVWLAMAYARRGDGNKAVELLRMLLPTSHTMNEAANALYRVEPYVVAADIYDLNGQVGRGGWTWYTGSASWIYRIWLEEVLGFRLRGDKLSFKGAIPKEWDAFKIKYRYKSTYYEIRVSNPHHVSTGKVSIMLDGVAVNEIQLVDDGGNHIVEVAIKSLV